MDKRYQIGAQFIYQRIELTSAQLYNIEHKGILLSECTGYTDKDVVTIELNFSMN